MIDLKNLTIEEAHESLKRGEFTCRELANAYLKVIKEKNPEINAYIEVYDDVLDQADEMQKKFVSKTDTILTGIPFAIKDNILIKERIVSAGSKILENYKASYDATIIKNLKKAGAIFLGRTNMDEFAMGSSTQTSAFGVTKNPIDTTRVPGGSSGGSAAALAGDMTLAALGTDTCGSVREPSAFCGLVGLKPTYGAVSRQGIIAMGNSLDQVSPFGKCARDVEIIFDFLSNYDEEDSTSVSDELRDSRLKNQNSNSKKIGVPWHLFKEGIDTEVQENFKESLDKLKKAGYEILDIELPHAKYSLAVYYIIMPAEVSTNLSRFDGIRYGYSAEGENLMDIYKKSRHNGFGKEVRRRIILGTYVLSHGYYDAYYIKALKVREKIKTEIMETFKKVDYILTPTVPITAFKLGEKLDDPVSMYLCDIFSAPANLSGVPAIALPSGVSKDGLKFSIQFMASHGREDLLFEVGKKFETIM
ncbi:glutaminyl-tRNA synthase (glutamine-hydrolyzing) subunit A [Candidatus Nomurabacteria bacterium RIFCSPHIGHO2_01_FULL_37_25]|uniref:Glutamyl-tRNA(Gln) amidotransferase subunit A n=1 Tax=Candidatus Nomurabacteria bacterium RIFCSPLOWO2_01_FULL_36_16 TaxID=1801767 RepID=A0A1F6WYA9_9BACT|nr:MAG: glutaminyl-tRNA synthase (glutamine-hydrolyzing) subunit A [Candidatus Nomurabacteria bacterium RIFCSPHIGHO2_01_FULL_37_25]OGI75208.1 MAG: glutaminyl-tRNA synthase (glutamine-hydrolyzing) subunit A [Candidatus Nomurabacteria bacterium RIFCSPHIGHO2_02_FULL_36_29]OGI86853.1 MAG: glutaminyl-tRNA synthase (glutamine-hydrolyzing) subunit A [Candidatus Nomurabacteria bacterium RIFCSPLOWO2_01_FULL_36_16]OGI96783.1 MAG: glutaminyl-tRNA synthase (glutamine-hydrolyzing) subunit A [Candidatus Nomur